MNNKLDQEELDILESVERGGWQSVLNFEERKKELEVAARKS